MARGPSTTAPGKAPRSAILHRQAASTVACILGFTVSTAARQAALGVSMPRARATSMALRRISAFSVRVGAMFRPPSVLMSSRSRPGICRTIRWLARPEARASFTASRVFLS